MKSRLACADDVELELVGAGCWDLTGVNQGHRAVFLMRLGDHCLIVVHKLHLHEAIRQVGCQRDENLEELVGFDIFSQSPDGFVGLVRSANRSAVGEKLFRSWDIEAELIYVRLYKGICTLVCCRQCCV